MPREIESSKLIVADSHLPRAEALAAFLAPHGFEARALADGGEAIVVAETWPADAAVLSIPLAGVSGLEVARHLRQSFGPSFRLVACSPTNDSNSLQHLATAGFNQVVAFPEPASILAALGEKAQLLVVRSMQQTVRRIELLVVLGHSLLGLRQHTATPANVERVGRIVVAIDRDIARLELPKERERLQRELNALAERIPDPRMTRL